MSVLGRIGNAIGGAARRLPGGNAMAGALGKSPVLGRLPGVRPPVGGLGPSPNGLANAAGAMGAGMMRPSGDIGIMRPGGDDMTQQPYMPPEGPQNTGVTGGMIPPPDVMQQGPPPPDQPVMQGPPQSAGGIGPNPAVMQEMMQRKQMMDQRNQMNRQQMAPRRM